MKSIHSRSAAGRLVAAIYEGSLGQWRSPSRVARFVRSWAKFPLEYSAARVIENTPAAELDELLRGTNLNGNNGHGRVFETGGRHGWNVRLDEQIYIGGMVRSIKAKQIFEIGTFDGRTTREMADAAGAEARIFTLDLPEAEFDKTQDPGQFTGAQVGACYRGTQVENRITQLYGNSMHFDFSEYEGRMDLVFVDAAHDYEHGLADSQTALRLARPGGLILWHDYAAGWPGLVHAIREATIGLPLQRVGNTALAVLRVPENARHEHAR